MTHTPEEMYSESESDENVDNENEDQRHCLAVKVDNPEFDDMMGAFGYENLLYEICIYEIMHYDRRYYEIQSTSNMKC